MLKKVLVLVVAMLTLCTLFCGCGDTPSNTDDGGGNVTPPEIVYYDVTFKQDGEADVVIKVERGKALPQESIPTVKPKAGHTVVWEEKDLTNVTENITVNAIATPNTYKIFLEWNAPNGIPTSATEQTEITVTYGQKFTLPTYGKINEDGWKIDYWYISGNKNTKLNSGIYTLTKNVTITAEWSLWAS